MRLPLQITFRRMPHTEAIELAIRERVEKLDRFCDLNRPGFSGDSVL